VAFSKGDTLVAAAEPHCGARWIVKMDVRNFFESINEISVYRVFQSLGFQRLISLELARICTRLGSLTTSRKNPRWWSNRERETIKVYGARRMGHLPQGAPTSPMLANLAVRKLDELIEEIAAKHGMIYTRYADDLTVSTKDKTFNRDKCRAVIGEIYAAMAKHGLSPNTAKTIILSPGSRKIVLGLLVDGEEPRLQRDFRILMRQHLYYLTSPKHGPADHARIRGFSSIRGMRHHIHGLATFARQVEKPYGEECLSALNKVNWPV
ncbi:reverse transcriptase family protein, partial [Mesorhizobium sp. M7A.F.Ca.US.007.01.1.1]